MTVTIAPTEAPDEVRAFIARAAADVGVDLERRLAIPSDDPGRLVEAMHYAATGPGKRLRPALVLATAEALGASRATAMPAASAIEMLHAYTLVHDDLPAMDDDDERRGRPTVHIVFGEAIAILAGDGLLTQAFACLADLDDRAARAVACLAKRAGSRELLGGQAIDLTRPPTDFAGIERLHAGKTGALFAAATELGAIAAGASAQVCADFAHYGMLVGIAFQHADDRDDAEFQQHANAAAERIRGCGLEAEAIARRHGAALLAAYAAWIASRA